MHIPKSKMPAVLKALQFVIDCAEDRYDPPVETHLEKDELELIKQMYDRVSLVQHGDANFLTVEAYYGHKPEQGI
jgi:hypothetical protein